MSDSRSRFEAWIKSEAKARAAFRLDPAYVWQAAEAETARKCGEMAGKLATHQAPSAADGAADDVTL